MTNYKQQIHKVWIVPLEKNTLAGNLIVNTLQTTLGGGGFDFQYILSPLVFVEKYRGKLSARNRDLNPIGLKRNLRQHFGSNSNKIKIQGFISPIAEYQDTSIFGIKTATAVTQSKYTVLKQALLNQIRFLIIYNNDFEIATIDELDYREDEDYPYVYHVSMSMTSLRVYDGFKDYLLSLSKDIALNTIVQNILPSLEFT